MVLVDSLHKKTLNVYIAFFIRVHFPKRFLYPICVQVRAYVFQMTVKVNLYGKNQPKFIKSKTFTKNDKNIDLTIREYSNRISATISETEKDKKVEKQDANKSDSIFHLEEEVKRLENLCQDYRAQIKAIRKKSDTDLVNYKIKLENEFRVSSNEFRENSLRITEQKQKLLETQYKEKLQDKDTEINQLKTQLVLAENVITKTKKDSDTLAEHEVKSALATEKTKHDLILSKALKEAAENFKLELKLQRDQLQKHFKRDLSTLAKDLKPKSESKILINAYIQTDPVKFRDERKLNEQKKENERRFSEFSAKVEQFRNLSENNQHKIDSLVQENINLRNRLTSLSIENSELKFKASK